MILERSPISWTIAITIIYKEKETVSMEIKVKMLAIRLAGKRGII